MLRAMTTWLYDGDPLALLSFESLMSEVKTRISTEESFLKI